MATILGWFWIYSKTAKIQIKKFCITNQIYVSKKKMIGFQKNVKCTDEFDKDIPYQQYHFFVKEILNSSSLEKKP